MTIASQPQRLPAIAKPLLASESLMRLRQWTLADYRELRGGGQRAADQRTEGKNEGSLGRERIDDRRAFVQQQLHAQAAAAEELAQNRFRTAARTRRRRCTRRSEGSNRGNRRASGFLILPRRRTGSARESSWPSGVARIADELIAVQVGHERGVQPVHGDELAEGRNRAASVPSTAQVFACTSNSETPARWRGTPRNSTCIVTSRIEIAWH